MPLHRRRPEDTALIRLLQLTDFHLRLQPGDTLLGVDTEHSFKGTLRTALAEGITPDLALLTGDLAQDATAETYQRLARALADLPCPAYCLPGNHDDPALMAAHLANKRLHCQPLIQLDHWQIICLNSTIPHSPLGRLSDSELELLRHGLEADSQRHTLIALHHHPVASGSAWMDRMQISNADSLFAVLRHYPTVRGIVFGHIHQALDQTLEGIRILGSPSTCFQFKPGQADFALDALPPGHRWIELHDDGRIETRVHRMDALPDGLKLGSGGY